MRKTTKPLLPLFLEVARRGSGMRMQSLAIQLRTAIKDGRLRPGIRLPSTRDLALRTGLSRNTVLAAYDALVVQGLAYSRRGSGTYVAESIESDEDSRPAPFDAFDRRLNALYHDKRPGRSMAVEEGTFDLRVGLADWRLFPFDIWRRLSARAYRTPGQGVATYLNSVGPAELREAIATQLSVTRAVACRPSDIIVTAGAQQAFDLLARILVNRPGAAVAVEDPGYASSREAFAAAGAGIVPIDVDQHGMRVGTIPKNVQVVLVTPSHQYPLGSQLSEERRAELLHFAKTNDALIVEDDYDGEFQFRGRPLEALKTLDREGRVFYVGTFSKTLLPSLRIGYVVAPPWARDALAYAKQCADLHSSTLPQAVLADFITSGHMERHLSRMRRVYQGRCDRLVTSLQRHCTGLIEPFAPAAGLHVVVLLPTGTDSKALAARCRDGGVALNSLVNCWAHQPKWSMLGLGIGLIRDEDIDPAIRRLKALAFP